VTWLLLLVAATIPQECVRRESVAIIEYNRFYGESGQLVFEQLIFIDIDRSGGEEITAWRMVKHPSQVPAYDWERGCFVTTWYDSDSIMRSVFSHSLRDTFLQYDPELLARNELPQEKRRGLKDK
jgi:hypothetical protein